MKRNKFFDYESRYGDSIGETKIPWSMTLAGPEGANYHFWFPKHLRKEELKNQQDLAKRAAHRMGDPVRFSWDYKPDK